MVPRCRMGVAGVGFEEGARRRPPCGRYRSARWRWARACAGRAGAGAGASGDTRGSHSSHFGRYQFQSPRSFIVAGSSTPRMIVASIRTATAEPHAELLEDQQRQGGEDREDRDHHGGGAGHDAGGGLDPVCDRVLGWPSAVERLADPGEDEHVVVHRESEQDHEQEQRHPRDDRAVGVEAQERLQMAVLEDPHEHSVGRPDREQVEHDRLDRDHDRAEGDEQQQEGRRQDEGEHERQVRLHRVVEVLRAGGEPTHVGRGAWDPPDRGRHQTGRGARPARRSISSRCRSRPAGCRPPRRSGRD